MIAGVAGGLGAHLGIDASLVRLAIVALSLFGGAGVLLYIAAVLLVDDAPAGTHAARAAPSDRNRSLTIVGVVLLVLVAGPLLFIPAMFAGGILVPVAMLALLGHPRRVAGAPAGVRRATADRCSRRSPWARRARPRRRAGRRVLLGRGAGRRRPSSPRW
jgi:phage shock protein PspC (stress-responsive transcriptional regulator)